MLVTSPVNNKFPKLNKESHTLEQLRDLVVAFTRIERQHWTEDREQAATKLLGLFDQQAVQKNVQVLKASQVDEIIVLLGRVFFLDGLRHVKFSWIVTEEKAKVLMGDDFPLGNSLTKWDGR